MIKETGHPPKLGLLTHVDGDYGNLTDAKAIAAVCHEYGVPLLLNAAYTAGRMEVRGKDLGADFLVCSCHKGFGVPGTIGILATINSFKDILFRKSLKYSKKDVELLGCTARSGAIAALIAAFPYIKERVKGFDEEVKKARWFVEKMELLGKIHQLGIRPTWHEEPCNEG